MKYIKLFNESIESESELLSDALIMAFDDKNITISEVGPSGLPFEILKRKYVDEVGQIQYGDVSFCLGSNTQPRSPGSDNHYEIVISFMMRDRYKIELILRDFYRRIARFKWSKVSESMCNINGYEINRTNQHNNHHSRVFKRIYIKKANIKK